MNQIAPQKSFKNSVWLGLMLGLVLPALAPLVFFILQKASTDLLNFIKELSAQGLLLKMLSIGAMLNLGAFFLFINQNRVKVAQGVILATFVYTFLVLLSKFL